MSDRLRRLEELRDLLADSLTEAQPDKRAPLAAQYRAVLADLESLAGAKEGDPVDEIARRRAVRRAGSA